MAREGFQCGADRVTVLVRMDMILKQWIRLTQEYWLAVFLEGRCRSKIENFREVSDYDMHGKRNYRRGH